MAATLHILGKQPLLHDAVVALAAPAQVWSGRDGEIDGDGIEGVYVADIRVLRKFLVRVDGRSAESIATLVDDARAIRFVGVHRVYDDAGADPDVRSVLRRRVDPAGVRHELELESRLGRALEVEIEIEMEPDASSIHRIKAGRLGGTRPGADIGAATASWQGSGITARLDAPGATIDERDGRLRVRWRLSVPAHGSASVLLDLRVDDRSPVVRGASGTPPWTRPDTRGRDDRLRRWVTRSLADLDALRMVSPGIPRAEFLAAGAPWFLTLFGRDSLWAARFLLPTGTALPMGTLRVLAALRGRRTRTSTAEQPGKIPHELRRETFAIPDEGVHLPPLYYGTVDATPLWICLLVDTWRAGHPLDEVRELLPALEAALGWMRDFGDSDGDGLLEYVDESGHGLSNQGWKDSWDAVQWRDGTLARGPVALCEVQAYAHLAALGGADLLDALGRDGTPWRTWAARLATRFRESFWVEDADGRYPAIALDGAKRAVDSLTSNLGHLLGTGLLDADERRLVADRLVAPELSSGFGLRTMATTAAGYWPLSYHGGSVWTHDTAIAIAGLAADGFAAEAATLGEGLLRAAAAFDYRMPELYSGDDADAVPTPIPYPAACRPQAWSAAAAIAVLSALPPPD